MSYSSPGKAFFFCAFSFITFHLYGQTSSTELNGVASRFIKTVRNSGEETIFLHTDKSFYLPGETLWIKAYTLNAFTHKPSRVSKTLFVDLVNDRDSAIAQLYLNNELQVLDASINLPVSLSGGTYWLRAFTKNSLREDSTRISLQPVYLYNLDEDISHTAQAPLPVPSVLPLQVEFSPESGSILPGENLVAVIAKDNSGKPVKLNGAVLNREGVVSTNFETDSSGLGQFTLNAQDGEVYRVRVRQGSFEKDYSLPGVLQTGFHLSLLKSSADSLSLKISIAGNTEKISKYSLLGITRDQLWFAATVGDKYVIKVSKKEIPGGIGSFVLFNSKGEVLCERCISNEKNSLSVSATTHASSANVNGGMVVAAAGSEQQKILASFSVAVTDDRFNPPSVLHNNTTDALYAETEGSASSSGQDKNEITDRNSNILLLAHKPLYLSWYNRQEVHLSADRFMDLKDSVCVLTGRVIDRKKKPVKDRIVILYTDQETGLLGRDTTDESGRFRFKLPDYYGEVRFSAQVTNLKGSRIDEKAFPDTMFFPVVHTPAALKTNFTSQEAVALSAAKFIGNNSTIAHFGKEWLQEVTVRGKRKKQLNYDESKRMSMFSRIVTSDMFAKGGMNAVENALLMVPGVHLMGNILVVGGPTGIKKGFEEPLLVLDGVPIDFSLDTNSKNLPAVTNSALLDYIQTIPVSVIDFVEVLTGAEAAVYGSRGGSGVIIINTLSKPRPEEDIHGAGYSQFSARGYFVSKQFSAAENNSAEIKKASTPGQHSTIYWNSNLLLEGNNPVTLDVPPIDASVPYTVTIMGISSSGEILFHKQHIHGK